MQLTAKQASKILGLSHRQTVRLIQRGVLKAELQDTPVPYYLIDPASVEAYKQAPKNKGGRPTKIEIITKLARGTIKAFLDNKQSIKWALNSPVAAKDIRGQILTDIFAELKGYGDQARYQELLAEVQSRGWLDKG